MDEGDSAQSGIRARALFAAPRLIPIIPIVDPIPLAASLPETESRSKHVADDGGAGAPVDGLYLGQISARIDRAWRRPAEPLGGNPFICQARIDQDAAGNVVEVMIEGCNGTPGWQLSLVRAIQSASPLPAPPDPALFVRTLHMSFQAQPPDSPQAGAEYEREYRAAVSSAAPAAIRPMFKRKTVDLDTRRSASQ
jgi:hypothetical protein